MKLHRIHRVRWIAVGAAAAALASASCGAPAEGSEDLAQESAAVTITTCTGAAISAAVATGGTVTLSCGSSPITITVPSTTVAHSTTLSSVGAGKVTLAHQRTLFTVSSGATFNVSNINFDGSQAPGFAPAFVTQAPSPGSIGIALAQFAHYTNNITLFVGGGPTAVVSLSAVVFLGTSSSSFGPFIYNEGATVSVVDSSFSNNMITGSNGAAIDSVGGSLSVSRSTFFNNRVLASLSGGAIVTSCTSAPCSITNSTFAGNFAGAAGGAVVAGGTFGTTISYSTFVENQSPMGTIGGSATVNASIIVDSTPKSAPCSLAGSSNLQWPAVTPLCGAGFRYADPKLGAFGNNGGLTATFPLTAGSAAIDASSLACPPPSTDQRSLARPRDGDGNGTLVCDIGSFEL